MRTEYDFSDARRGRFADRTKQQITIRIDADTIAYFKELSEKESIPYQTLINQYLADCVKNKRAPEIQWK